MRRHDKTYCIIIIFKHNLAALFIKNIPGQSCSGMFFVHPQKPYIAS